MLIIFLKRTILKQTNLKFEREISNFIKNRRVKLLLTMYKLCVFMFIILIITDLFKNQMSTVLLEVLSLILIASSYFIFYKRKHYDIASYFIITILGFGIIMGLVLNEFNNYLPVYSIPFMLGTFFLFSFKKSFILNIIFFITLYSVFFYMKDIFNDNHFLNNYIAMGNLTIILLIIFIFSYFYEMSRIEDNKRLIDLNYKKDLLYRELQHRVKNNLNIVSSMLSMQALKESQTVKDIIEVSTNRIDSLAMVHSMLYVSDDIENVNVKKFLEKLSNNLKNNANHDVLIELNIKEVELPLNEIIPLGLIVNELLTNSFKYAFKETSNPKINIVFKMYQGNAIFTYHDNGKGYVYNESESMGLKLVELNVKQLKGTLRIKNKNGLGYKISYKRKSNV